MERLERVAVILDSLCSGGSSEVGGGVMVALEKERDHLRRLDNGERMHGSKLKPHHCWTHTGEEHTESRAHALAIISCSLYTKNKQHDFRAL